MDKLINEAKSLIALVKSNEIDEAGSARLVELNAEIKAAQIREASITEGEALIAGVKSAGSAAKAVEDVQAKSLGDHFIKSFDGAGFPKANFEAAEFKAVGDPTLVGASEVNDVDKQIVGNTRVRPSVAALFNSGSVSGNGITYRVELPVQGSIAAVAEGDPKAQVTYTYEEKREGISTVAGFTEISDDMRDDLPYVASEINSNLVTDLDIEVDRQVLDGDGIGPNVLGVLRRSGVQVVASADTSDNLDAIHRASTLVSIASNRETTAMVIHPLDYEKAVLTKDANGSYLAGGPFVATVGKGLWAIPAIVTTAISQGTALVGAFDSASFLKKGGIAVKSTDSHDGNFVKGITTIVAEQRAGLKVGKPAAFAKVTLSTAAPV
jgi:HK97 family phage major capsid protein